MQEAPETTAAPALPSGPPNRAGAARGSPGGLARLRHNRWLRGAMNLLFVVLLMQGVSSFQARNQPTGISLSSLALPSLDGSVVSFASFKGKPTLLAFFAPWCGVCKAQAPNLRWLKGLLGDRVNVVSVAASYQKIEAVKAYAAEHEQGLPVLIEGDALAAKLKVSAFPTVYFLDREGRVKRSAVGYTTTLGLMARLLL